MQAVRRVGAAPRGVEHALVDHHPGAVPALLAGLEHQHDVTLEVVAVLGQQAGAPDERGGVQVVPAGVHRAVGGGVRQAGLLAARAARPCRRAGAPCAARRRHGDRRAGRRSPTTCRCRWRPPGPGRRARRAPAPGCGARPGPPRGCRAAASAGRSVRPPWRGHRLAGPSSASRDRSSWVPGHRSTPPRRRARPWLARWPRERIHRRPPGPGHRDLLRRDRRRHRPGPHPARRRRRLLGGGARALRRRRPRGRLAGPPRGDGPDDPAGLRDRRHRAGRRRRGRGHGRPGPRRRAPGRGGGRQGAGPGAGEAAVRREPPGRPRRRRPARARPAARPVPGDAGLRRPLLAAAGRGRHRLGHPAGRDHRRRGGRGLRQGGPAARPALPRRPAHRPGGDVGLLGRHRLPAWPQRSPRPRAAPLRLLLLRPQDRRRPLGAGPASSPASRCRSPTSRPPSRRRSATCSPARPSTPPSPRASTPS